MSDEKEFHCSHDYKTFWDPGSKTDTEHIGGFMISNSGLKDFIDHVDNMLSKANVVGKPDFKVTSSGGFTYNTVKIQKIMGIAATSLGFKNYDEFEKFLNYNPNSVESKIFDDEILF